MAVVRGDFSNTLEPGARKWFKQDYEQRVKEYPALFNVTSTDRAFEEDFVSVGLGTMPERPEGEEVATDKPYYRGTVKYTALGFGLSYDVTQEAVDDDLYGAIVPSNSKYLARSHADAEEVHAAGVFNNWTGSTNTYDGVDLLSTAHTGVGISNQANRPASDADLSAAAIQASFERIEGWTDDRGLKIRLMPRMLVTGPGQQWIANEIASSQFKPYTANNEINVLQGKFDIMIYHYLTDTDAWFFLTNLKEGGPVFFWRKKPRFRSTFDEKTEVASYIVTSRFVAGITDWRALDGSTGA